MAGRKAPTLGEIAKEMKWECYERTVSQRTLSRGLQLELTPEGNGWKLKLSREDAMPSNQEYKVVAKAFFNKKVKHVRQPNENAIEMTTAKNWE